MGMSWFWHGDDRIQFESGRGGMFRPAIQTTRKLTFVTIGLRHIAVLRISLKRKFNVLAQGREAGLPAVAPLWSGGLGIFLKAGERASIEYTWIDINLGHEKLNGIFNEAIVAFISKSGRTKWNRKC